MVFYSIFILRPHSASTRSAPAFPPSSRRPPNLLPSARPCSQNTHALRSSNSGIQKQPQVTPHATRHAHAHSARAPHAGRAQAPPASHAAPARSLPAARPYPQGAIPTPGVTQAHDDGAAALPGWAPGATLRTIPLAQPVEEGSTVMGISGQVLELDEAMQVPALIYGSPGPFL